MVSITHVDQPYLFTVPAPRDAWPDAADQAVHDVLTSLYPAAKRSLDQLLATEPSAILNSQRKRDGIRVGATVAQLLIGLRAADGSAAIPPLYRRHPAGWLSPHPAQLSGAGLHQLGLDHNVPAHQR